MGRYARKQVYFFFASLLLRLLRLLLLSIVLNVIFNFDPRPFIFDFFLSSVFILILLN